MDDLLTVKATLKPSHNVSIDKANRPINIIDTKINTMKSKEGRSKRTLKEKDLVKSYGSVAS